MRVRMATPGRARVNPHTGRSFHADRQGVDTILPGVSKRRVRLLSPSTRDYWYLLFLALGQYLTQFWQVKGHTQGIPWFCNFTLSKTIWRSGMIPSPACSPLHFAQNEFAASWFNIQAKKGAIAKKKTGEGGLMVSCSDKCYWTRQY